MFKTDFEKFAMSRGISSMNLDSFTKANYVNPMILEERQMNVTSIDIYSRMLMDRILFLNTNVESTMANILTAQLLWLDQQSNKPINMYINSPGGSVIDGLQLIDTMNFINAPISTTCLGMAASMGAVILSCGEKGKRFVLPHSRVMIHQPRGGVEGQESDIAIHAKEIIRLKKLSIEYFAYHTGKNVDQIANDMERDFFMSAEDAKNYGIVDHVMPKRK